MYKLCLICLSLLLILFAVACIGETSLPAVSTTTFTPTSTSVSMPAISDPSAPVPSPAAGAFLNKGCLKPFQEFAYTLWDLGDDQVALPPPPWRIEASIPVKQVEGYSAPDIIGVVLARSSNGGQEVWIKQEMLSSAPTPGIKSMFTIYQSASRSWRNVSANIEDTEYYVSDLFVTKDGSVWGSTTREYHDGEPVPVESVPVLSKFDERTQRFEFAPGVLEVSLKGPDDPKSAWYPYFAGIDIVLDTKRDFFWIFSEEDGIYRYEPNTRTTQKWLGLPDLKVFSRPVLSPDGSIFVEDFRLERMEEPYFHLYEGSLFQFFPDTREFVQLEMPDDPWPSFSGWLVTQTGRLWLGAVGYREPDGSWYLLHPDPAEYFKHAGDQAWSPPYLMLESSNGLLWYQKFLDMGPRYEGTAWYNPETGEGCMFTNSAVWVIEGPEQQLWLAANANLYKYDLQVSP